MSILPSDVSGIGLHGAGLGIPKYLTALNDPYTLSHDWICAGLDTMAYGGAQQSTVHKLAEVDDFEFCSLIDDRTAMSQHHGQSPSHVDHRTSAR